ncbi:uncharacterized protein [Musca autumnalis]|uniref:uncharacterized protein n=1 Tax=Musca autumnalis TaxID=221902 RepID=UPI003CE9FD24
MLHSVMSVLAYPSTSHDELFRRCTKQCGIVLSTEDQQYFALECMTCSDKFQYLNAFIQHLKTKHDPSTCSNEVRARKRLREDGDNEGTGGGSTAAGEELPSTLETSSVVIKEEKYDMEDNNPDSILEEACIKNEPLLNNDDDYGDGGGYYDSDAKKLPLDSQLSMPPGDSSYIADTSYTGDSNASYNDEYEDDDDDAVDDDANYDDMVEESLLNVSRNYWQTIFVLAYPSTSHDELFRRCTKQCGIVLSTEDQQYFALECMTCSDKFQYLNAFIQHLKTKHDPSTCSNEVRARKRLREDGDNEGTGGGSTAAGEELPSTLETSSVVIKEEKYDMEDNNPDSILEEACIKNEPLLNNDDDYGDGGGYYDSDAKKLPLDSQLSMPPGDSSYIADTSYTGDSNASYNDEYEDDDDDAVDDDANYDDMVEESLLNSSAGPGVTNHIKDRKMIKFLIEAFRRNSFLWDPNHPQFRHRIKRSEFLDWMNAEFKRRYNLTLAKDAITRKWENLRTVYKRECNRMTLENTNISTLWYFKEMHFLNHLYGGKQEITETVIHGVAQRKRLFALWNDVSTNRLIELLKQHPCFYDHNNIDYGNKEKKSEALQKMAIGLTDIVEVSPIQITKRIAQLRYDYSKQKHERIRCEITGRLFTPNYIYYELLFFMDDDIAPFKCDQCSAVLKSIPELEAHQELSHKHHTASQSLNMPSSSTLNQSSGNNTTSSIADFNGGSNYYCPVCEMCFNDLEQLNAHKKIHPQFREVKYHCDLCTASFRDKSNYDEHIRRHNDELLLPDLNLITPADMNDEAITYFSSTDDSNSSFKHKCTYPGCSREFTTRSNMMVHSKTHYADEEFPCDVCGKVFRTVKNLQNHKQIHSAIKKYVCKICGSAFAQAAGLYLHKRRHNRQAQ